jgi:hypothetical protein
VRYDAGGAAGVYSLGDALLDLGAYGREKPTLSMIPSIELWIGAQGVRRVAAIEARRRHLQEEPEILREIGQRVDNFVLDSFYGTEVAPGGEPGPEDVRQAYERNQHSYQRLDEVELLVVSLRDSAVAAALVAHAGHAPSLREAVEMASPGARVREERVRYPNAPARWKPYQTAFMEMAPHQCLGPLSVEGGWLVAQLVSKRQEAQPFDQLSPQIVQVLRQQATDALRDRTFNRITDRLRREFNPEVHPERLRDVRWPIAIAATRAG